MSRRASYFVGSFVLMIFMALSSTSVSYAESVKKSALAGSPYDLVNAVNAFRASFGIALYSSNSILMSAAQARADFLAATGSMTHSSPGGIGLTDRLTTPDDERRTPSEVERPSPRFWRSLSLYLSARQMAKGMSSMSTGSPRWRYFYVVGNFQKRIANSNLGRISRQSHSGEVL